MIIVALQLQRLDPGQERKLIEDDGRRRSGGSCRRRISSKAGLPRGGEEEGEIWTMLLVGRTMAFLGAGWMQLASRLSPICYLLYLARKGKRS
jgi:hypothetical protein